MPDTFGEVLLDLYTSAMIEGKLFEDFARGKVPLEEYETAHKRTRELIRKLRKLYDEKPTLGGRVHV